MRRSRHVTGVVALALLACASCTEHRAPHAAPAPPRAATSAPARVAPAQLATLPGAILVVPPSPEPLPYALLPIEGSDDVLAVSQAPGRGPTFAQRLDAATHAFGPAFEPGRAYVAAAFAAEGDAMTLVSIGGFSLDVERRTRDGVLLTGSVSQQTADWAPLGTTTGGAPADVIVKVGARLLALTLGPLPEEDEDPPGGAAVKPSKPAKEKATRPAPAPKRAPAKNPAKAPGKKKSRDAANKGRRAPAHDEATSPARRPRALWGGWLGEIVDGRAAEPFDTGVRVEEPMAGLGLVGAGVRAMHDGTPRIDVVFYEWAGTGRTQSDKAVGRARFATVGLDAEGAFVEGTRASFDEGDLFFGFLAPSLYPRLVTTSGGSVLLSQAAQRGACQATLVTPGRAPLGVANLACAIDPARLVEAAEERRKPTRNPALATRAQAFEAMASALVSQGAHRAEGQPSWDGPLTVLGPTRGYTVLGSGELRSFDRRTFEVREEPRPLVPRRARAYAASIAADGETLVRTQAGLRVVHADGSIDAASDPLAAGPGREDERFGPSPFAHIGRSWWTARGAPRRLFPDATTSRSPGSVAHPQAAVLVGGESSGILLELDGDALTTSSLDEAGSLRVLSRVKSPITPPFDAVAREGGGALVVGPRRDRSDRWIALVVTPDGTVHRGGADLEAALHGPAPTLVALPGRGAVLMPRQVGGSPPSKSVGSAATWLDARGDAAGEVALTWPSFPCLDGVPTLGAIPDVRPGVVRKIDTLAAPGVCVVGLPAVDRAGAIRFVVSHRVGADTAVELVRVAGEGGAPDDASPLGPALAPYAARAPRCPAEMVLVDERFCVDRWESAISEGQTGRLVSPDYPITPNLFASVLGDWATHRERLGSAYARAFPLPRPEPFQLTGVASPTAVSRAGLLPSGYLTGLVARDVCAAAGKRLCDKDEFRTACRGEAKTRFPYGDAYVEGACNVGRAMHPAAILHGHASIGHLDPRLGRVPLEDGAPGPRRTGATPTCASRWGGDAIYDMVGNLDEWVDEKGGAFAGGFYARGTKSGCDALVDNHPPSYLDYSTGVRCCRDAR